MYIAVLNPTNLVHVYEGKFEVLNTKFMCVFMLTLHAFQSTILIIDCVESDHTNVTQYSANTINLKDES